ncbi:MAG: hypothetical protein LBR95_06850 [Azoarcus sp.]|jgi:hypothetical protein|nr:hypothetical protein [Azoarcus sp.]
MTLKSPLIPLTLAEQRARFSHDDLAFCTSYLLYILIEKGIRPDDPDWVEIACQKFGSELRMLVFRSPIDAMVMLIAGNRQGHRYEICPFELLDPRPFMKKHGDVLRLAFVYGFAAEDGKVLSSQNGSPFPLLEMMNFGPVPDYSEHFHLVLDENFMDWMNRQILQAGLTTYGEINRELSESPLAELEQLGNEALAQVSGRVIHGGEPIMEHAFFDTIERHWRFIPSSVPSRSGLYYAQSSATIN